MTTLLGTAADTLPADPPRPRVLVADDEARLLRIITRILTAAGFEVTQAHDGRQAAQQLKEQSFDAVLTDVSMPEMTGLDLLRSARMHDLELPILLMTGAPDVASAAEAVRHGACAYISKPFVPAALERAVRRAVDLSQLARAKREAMRLLGSNQPEAGDLAGLEVTFERALESMWIAYQPIVKTECGDVFGYEALLRSNEPALPNPAAVLRAAERLGRLHDLGRAVRAKAAAPMPSLPPDTHLFINLHPRDLEDPSLTSRVEPLCAVAARVVLEITERASLDGVRDVRGKVAQLREMGFRVAVDDLGAGYAGLTSFAQLEPEFVKLDMSLIRDIHKSPVKQKLVQSMTELCTDMGISVVAEGIEVSEERDSIASLGCTLSQGYLLGRPSAALPAAAA
ncbi:MAG TPA: EAL domain-containing protein [Polyangiaceae bacterium]|nr:EAL domain-containing protein [Polyangiaceae bacterium]